MLKYIKYILKGGCMYNLTTEEVFSEVKSSRKGLDNKEAKNRLLENGKNVVNLNINRSFKDKFTQQLKQIMMIVLFFALVANVVSMIISKDTLQIINVLLILAVIVLNFGIGINTTSKMEKTLSNIKKALPLTSRVKRNNKVIEVASEDVVVGDIVYLCAGDVVPADMRLIEANSLNVKDTIITGQTMSTLKTCDVINGKYMPLGDRNNMVYLGSSVVSGSGIGIVVATGKDTELGKAEKLLHEEVDINTPVVKGVNKVINVLSCVILLISVLSFIGNMIHRGNASDSLIVFVSLAVCIVPESLFIAIYSTLIRGINILGKNNILVKKFASVEELGKIDVLCIDKTKVLTMNNKMVKDIWVSNMADYDLEDNPNYATLINCMLLCNDTNLESANTGVMINGVGLEKALVKYALSNGYNKDHLQGSFPQINVFPFDRYRKMMTTLNSVGDETQAFTKGDFERVFNRCTHILIDGRPMRMTDFDREIILNKYNTWKKEGASVVGYATKVVKGNFYELQSQEVEKDMTFVGISSILDPVKADTEETLKELKKMDIKVVMMTSDDKEVAYLTAKSLGIAKSEKQVVTGAELDMMTDVELHEKITGFTVFSKLLNGQKLRLVKALQRKYVVAVTGDNVEDLTALQRAEVGIGLAKAGCEVVKQTSDVLVKDDSIKSITEGIKTSKRIQYNITKMVEYMLSLCVAEILIMSVFVLAFNKLLFSPTLIIWLNFINGLLPCFALGNQKNTYYYVSKADKNALIGVGSLKRVFIHGLVQGLLICVLYLACTEAYLLSTEVATTMCFVAMAFMSMFHAFNVKSGDHSVLLSNPLDNDFLNAGLVVSLLATMAFIGLSLTTIHMALGITTLTFMQWIVSMCVGVAIIPLIEFVKFLYDVNRNKKDA